VSEPALYPHGFLFHLDLKCFTQSLAPPARQVRQDPYLKRAGPKTLVELFDSARFFRDAKLNSAILQCIMLVNAKTVFGSIAIIVLLFFAIIFAMAASVSEVYSRLTVAGLLFITALVIAFLITRRPKIIIQKLEVSGEMKAVQIKCPNCSASVDANGIKIVSGVPYATCPYCGHTFEVTEEPKW